jgi:hypothetical protein
MFRTALQESKKALSSMNKSMKKARGFQGKTSKKVGKILKQKIGYVKKTLPMPSNVMEYCMKKAADTDICSLLAGRYQEFYINVCTSSPALCDDFRPPTADRFDSFREARASRPWEAFPAKKIPQKRPDAAKNVRGAVQI